MTKHLKALESFQKSFHHPLDSQTMDKIYVNLAHLAHWKVNSSLSSASNMIDRYENILEQNQIFKNKKNGNV